jgi:hypothetical protein
MNILDENIDFFTRQQLAQWKFHFRQIGLEIGHSGMKDFDEIIPLLHTLRRPTFLTRDDDFYHPQLRHPNYCLVHFDVTILETATYIRQFYRHPLFRTQAQRMGKVVRVHEHGITCWEVNARGSNRVIW